MLLRFSALILALIRALKRNNVLKSNCILHPFPNLKSKIPYVGFQQFEGMGIPPKLCIFSTVIK